MKKLKKPLFVVFLCGLICLIGCANRTVSDSKPKLSLAKHFNGLFYLGAAVNENTILGMDSKSKKIINKVESLLN